MHGPQTFDVTSSVATFWKLGGTKQGLNCLLVELIINLVIIIIKSALRQLLAIVS